ncbi:hypothetical protein ABZY05_26260, partial [Streptomyces canus]
GGAGSVVVHRGGDAGPGGGGRNTGRPLPGGSATCGGAGSVVAHRGGDAGRGRGGRDTGRPHF